MVKALLGKKVGMTQVFDGQGRQVPVTVLEVGPCFVTQVKDEQIGGRRAVQIGFEDAKRKNTPRPLLGMFDKCGVSPKKVLRDVDVEGDAEIEPGQRLSVDIFAGVREVDVSGTSKGRGFQGGVKRHGFAGGPASHGSKVHRGPGSLGPGTDPGRVFKGTRMAGHMGAEKVTVKNLEVVGVEPERNLLLVKGSVPGNRGGYVMVRKATGRSSDTG